MDDATDVRSSFYLEDVATEFDVQGLELDWSCVVWDGDWFVYTALDMGWKFTNKIKITNKGGEIIIEDICAVKE